MNEKRKNDSEGKKLYRAEKRGTIAGICIGLEDYFGIDATIIRLIFVVLAFTAGPGILAYIVLWFVLPDEQKIYPERYDIDGEYLG